MKAHVLGFGLLVLATASAAPAVAQPEQPAPPAAGGSAQPSQPAATVAGQAISMAEVDELIRPQIDEQLAELRAREQQLRLQAVEVLITRALIRKEALSRGTSEQALEKQEIDDKAIVGEPEAKSFYEANKARLGGGAEQDAMQQIREGLGRQRRSERRAAFSRELRAKYDVKVLIEPHRVDVQLGEGPVRGNPSAPVTVIEFSDFQCPYCVRARPVVNRVRETYGDKVRWSFRHFPLDFHPMAQKAGEAAACAGEQGKFWEMHDRLWQANGKLQVPELKATAAALSLSEKKFDECLDSGRYADLVSRDQALGASWGVNGTPAFFVNGRPLVGAQPFDEFSKVIDDELQRAGVAAPAATAAPAAR